MLLGVFSWDELAPSPGTSTGRRRHSWWQRPWRSRCTLPGHALWLRPGASASAGVGVQALLGTSQRSPVAPAEDRARQWRREELEGGDLCRRRNSCVTPPRQRPTPLGWGAMRGATWRGIERDAHSVIRSRTDCRHPSGVSDKDCLGCARAVSRCVPGDSAAGAHPRDFRGTHGGCDPRSTRSMLFA